MSFRAEVSEVEGKPQISPIDIKYNLPYFFLPSSGDRPIALTVFRFLISSLVTAIDRSKISTSQYEQIRFNKFQQLKHSMQQISRMIETLFQ